MLIRCQKCTTVYELDDKLIPPGGAPVQCSKCQHIFKVYPQRASRAGSPPPVEEVAAAPPPEPSAAEPEMPAVPEVRAAEASSAHETVETGSAETSPQVAPPPPPRSASAPPGPSVRSSASRAGAGTGVAADAGAPPPEPMRTADGRPIRKVVMPDEDAMQPPRPTMARPSGRSLNPGIDLGRLVIPVAVVVALAVVALLAWRLLGRRPDPDATRRRAEGHSLLLRDDRASLERAVVAFEDALRLQPGLTAARADRDLARALLLGLVQGEGNRIDARLDGALRQRAAYDAAGAAAAVPHALVDEIDALKAQRQNARGRAQALEASVRADLEAIAGERSVEVQRATAVLAAFGSDPARWEEVARRAPGAEPRDVWLDLAHAAASTRVGKVERRGEAIGRLEAIVKSNPDVMRVRLVLAEALAQAGRTQLAVTTLDGVLSGSPDHEDARALRADLLAPPRPLPVVAPPVSVPAPGPTTGNAGALAENPVAQASAELARPQRPPAAGRPAARQVRRSAH